MFLTPGVYFVTNVAITFGHGSLTLKTERSIKNPYILFIPPPLPPNFVQYCSYVYFLFFTDKNELETALKYLEQAAQSNLVSMISDVFEQFTLFSKYC